MVPNLLLVACLSTSKHTCKFATPTKYLISKQRKIIATTITAVNADYRPTVDSRELRWIGLSVDVSVQMLRLKSKKSGR